MGDIVNIKPARCHVCCCQDFYPVCFKKADYFLPVSLRFTAMDGICLKSPFDKPFGQFINAPLGPAKNEDFIDTLMIENFMKCFQLSCIPRHTDHILLNSLCRFPLFHFYLYRIPDERLENLL